MSNVRVVELFAGVGGFRIGLEQVKPISGVRYSVVWSSQWEPGKARQWASDLYTRRFGATGHSNEDIQKVVDNAPESIPDADVLVGGFPCQDYSVARTLKDAAGLEGKKGVLWWSIYNLLKHKGENAPRFLILENVDRLLKSPAGRRGRDFAIMLASLASLGYAVEWRVVNAADYGMPQRRRRVFIIGYKSGTDAFAQISSLPVKEDWLLKRGAMQNAFPAKPEKNAVASRLSVGFDPVAVSNEFSMSKPAQSPFATSGVMVDGEVWMLPLKPEFNGKRLTLGEMLEPEENVPAGFFIEAAALGKWKYMKGAKKEPRKSSAGHEYLYTEGAVVFPDPLGQPSRTIVTGEGGSTPSRFKHVVQTSSGRHRRLMPVELERLNMFPDNHTAGVPDTTRAFLMGNALVTGVVARIGETLLKTITRARQDGNLEPIKYPVFNEDECVGNLQLQLLENRRKYKSKSTPDKK